MRDTWNREPYTAMHIVQHNTTRLHKTTKQHTTTQHNAMQPELEHNTLEYTVVKVRNA